MFSWTIKLIECKNFCTKITTKIKKITANLLIIQIYNGLKTMLEAV